MDIRLFISEKGQLALACYDGVFKQPIEAVELDYQTTMLSLRLKDTAEPIELNCPVYYDSIKHVIGQKICTVGFYLENELAGAMFVPFYVTNMKKQGAVSWQ